MTPYDKLKSLPEAATYLKPGVTFEQLDAAVCKITDLESAKRLQDAKKHFFKQVEQILLKSNKFA